MLVRHAWSLNSYFRFLRCRFGVPFKEGNFWYSWRNSGLQNQSLLHRHTDKKGETTEVFLDPNLWTEDGTATVGAFSVGR